MQNSYTASVLGGCLYDSYKENEQVCREIPSFKTLSWQHFADLAHAEMEMHSAVFVFSRHTKA